MNINEFSQFFAQSATQRRFIEYIAQPNKHALVKGAVGSFSALLAYNLHQAEPGISLFILPDKEQAAYFMNDLEQLIGESGKKLAQKKVLFFPTAYRRAYDLTHIDNNNLLHRTEVIKRIGGGSKNMMIVSFPEALSEKIISKAYVSKNTLKLSQGEEVNLDFIVELLQEYGFSMVDFVVEPGQFSYRGGLIDVFSFSNDFPYRIEFFGDEVESIRSFDPSTQRSIEHHKKIQIIPNVQDRGILEKRTDMLTFMPPDSQIWAKNFDYIFQVVDQAFDKAKEIFNTLKNGVKPLHPNELFCDSALLKNALDRHNTIEIADHSTLFPSAESFQFMLSPQPLFHKSFELVVENLRQNTDKGIRNFIMVDQENQIKRISSIFKDVSKMSQSIDWEPVLVSLESGFIDNELNIACYTDHQIFDRYHRFHIKERFSNKEAITLKEIYNLQPGDFVTHVDHGIARFGGLEKINNNGKEQEAIRLHFLNNDLIYVSIHALHRISKFVSKDGTEPQLSKLGSKAWSLLKAKTKSKVKDIAKDLIALYAKRKAVHGYAFEPDSFLQNELEASFFYEDTPDQSKATEDIKRDMESSNPMDRLVCGDVGFGKTEVAIRAAFKAVSDNKQVAVLVPTTILALQHYNTFKSRLENFPVKVDYINRFRSAKQQQETLQKLKSGQIDILIGTHRIVSKDIEFKDLGLLIVDEEQKFGVSIKEKLKNIKVNVDTLTLTATPIPRTLQFSLMGARDLSIINTPPPNRYPVQTELHPINEDIIRNAIQYEISRRGQVYVINNRIQNIYEIAGLINKLVPQARVAVGHGQMDGAKLEQTMMDFIAGDYDVLVATTIVESGLDIPNANTMIIYDAHNYGLSDLHQLRGRVGRTNKKAFCYLLSPPLSVLTPEAKKRLQAIEEFSDLGSGFNISMRDLDIRGAGNILGAEQSGFISEIGFEMFHQIMDEAIQELKENEFKDVFKEENARKQKYFVSDSRFESDLELLIPDYYVEQTAERLVLYKKLDACKSEEELALFEEEISDRFGAIPAPVMGLMDSIRLRWTAQQLGFEKVVIKNQKMIAYLVYQQDSSYYSSDTFGKIISYIQLHPAALAVKEINGKLTLNFGNLSSLGHALDKLSNLNQWVFPQS
jgi:transcription-repair coupling factor (superfamily II helicase)